MRTLQATGIGRAALGAILGFALGTGITVAAGSLSGSGISTEPVIAIGSIVGLLGYLLGLGAFDYWLAWALGRSEPEEGHKGSNDWRRYFRFTTDHKVIGVQYLVTAFAFFFIAGLLAMLIRAELMAPGETVMGANTYNTVLSMHGTIMIAVALIAIIGGLGNFFVPLMIGAQDMAFPRLNALSYWLLPPAGVMILSSIPAGGFDTGWTAYPPLSLRAAMGQQFYILTLLTLGAASIMGAINFLVTIIKLRAPGMTFTRLPIFVWSILAASLIALFATSFLTGALVMLLLDRVAGTAFFVTAKGGNPLLWQHLFWFYSHPAVYIMIVPAFGVVMEILPVFARKPLFAYKLAVASLLTIVGMSFVVWAHHMFTSGMSESLLGPFMVATELISVPTGIVFLSAVGTIWLGRLWLVTPMLFALGFVATFLIGGITGIFLADVPTDLHLQDTYFVVAHFHYTILGGMIFALFAGVYHWFPKITGRMLNERLGKIHFWGMFIGFHATFLPMFWLGLNGMPRRVADYPPEFAGVNLVVSLTAFLLGASMLVFLYNVINSWVRGPRVVPNPWRAHTLEWQVSSPPPVENFEEIPHIVGSPYAYGTPGARHAVITASQHDD